MLKSNELVTVRSIDTKRNLNNYGPLFQCYLKTYHTTNKKNNDFQLANKMI